MNDAAPDPRTDPATDARTRATRTGAAEWEAPPAIAIVGVGCRFPGARGPEALWRNVVEGRNSVCEVPEHRIALGYAIDRYYDPRPRIPGRISSCKAGFIDHPECFDPAPFGITPRDAAAMEPQARMMLEVVWDAIEDAGLPFESLRGERVALLVGHIAEDFSRERIAVLGEDGAMRALDVRNAIGFARSAISGRISHLLDLRGPSMTLDTACSSSLYATHLACHSLWRGESKLALAGGVNLFLTPEGSLALSRSGMMAPDGRCKAFDASADGFVRAEGAGVVLLRPLADALANGDHIYALVRGTGVSADGRDGGHMMAPGRTGQVQAMRDAYRTAGFPASSIDFVEAHGTGTKIGDPVEVAALGDVMSEGRPAHRPLRISSVKGNIGHCESASGAAGLIRAALAIEHRTLPAQLHFETPNPQIPWSELPIEVQRETAPWPHPGVARVGVNSFGISGTNAHIVLESAPEPEQSCEAATAEPRLLLITAHDRAALNELAGLHLERLRELARVARTSAAPNETRAAGLAATQLADLAYTLARRHTHHAERLAIVADTPAALALELETHLAGTTSSACQRATARAAGPGPVVFVFPGQGGQWLGMGRDLLECVPAFRASIEAWDLAYRRHVDWSLLEVLRDERSQDGPLESLSVLQPVLVALQIALAELLAEHGIVADAVLGQSVGELAAAYVAGALDRDEVARLACARGAAVERVAGKGAMGLVALAEDEVRELVAGTDGRVEIAGQNGPSSTLLAGDRAPLQALVTRLEARGVFARLLDVDFASHCFHMDPLLDDFAAGLGDLAPRESRIPFYSTVEGGLVAGTTLGRDYWRRNLRQKVRFTDAVHGALELDGATFVELSPHPTIARPIAEIAAARGVTARSLSTLRRGQSGREALLRLLAALFVAGHRVDMQRLYPAGRMVRVPLYPYQKRPLWFAARRRADLPYPTHPLLGVRGADAADPRHSRWETLIDPDVVPALKLAERDPLSALPASFCMEVAQAVGAQLWPERGVRVEGLQLPSVGPRSATAQQGEARLALQVHFQASGEDRGQLRLYVRRAGEVSAVWQHVAEAALSAPVKPGDQPSAETRDPALERGRANLDRIRERCATEVAPDWPGAALARMGAEFPRRLNGLRALGLGARELLAQIEIPTACQNDVGHYHLHPVQLEMGIALAGCLLEPRDGGPFAAGLRTLAGFTRCAGRGAKTGAASVLCHASIGDDDREIDLAFYLESGACLAKLAGLATRPGAGRRSASAGRFVHRLAWSSPAEASVAAAPGRASRQSPGPCSRWIVAASDEALALRYARALGERCLATCDLDAARIAAHAEVAGSPSGLLVLGLEGSSAAAEVGPSARERLERLLGCLAAGADALAEVVVVARAVHGPSQSRAGAADVWRCASAVAWGAAAASGECDLAGAARQTAIDLPGDPRADEAEEVVSLICAAREASAYRLGDAGWLVPALEVAGLADGALDVRGATPAFAAEFAAAHQGERRATLRACQLPAPGKGEVALRVHAATLSQLDVRRALCLDRDAREAAAPSAAASLQRDGIGRECAGVISAVGADVNGFAVGDTVFGFARAAVASELITPAAWLVPLPSGFGFDVAAGLPLANVVAEHALLDLARLASGERVLILVGAGGVGLAATRAAHRRGARVLAAASSEAGRSALREFGAERVCEPSGSAFAAAVRDWAKPGEMDVVLSSLDDSRVEQALALLAPGGRFVDLRPPGARRFASMPTLAGNRAWLSFDLDAWSEQDPASLGRALQRAVGGERAANSRLPVTTFPVAELARALRFATQNRQRGRVAIDLAQPGPLQLETRPNEQRLSRLRRHWVSAGQARDIETQVQWLAERGARDFVVAPTRALGEGEAPLLARLVARGLRVEIAKGTRQEALLELGRESGRLGSVIHVVDTAAHDSSQVAEQFALMLAVDAATQALPPPLFLLVHAATDLFETPARDVGGELAQVRDGSGSRAASRGLRALADLLCRERRARGGAAASVGVADPGAGAAGCAWRVGQAIGLLVSCEEPHEPAHELPHQSPYQSPHEPMQQPPHQATHRPTRGPAAREGAPIERAGPARGADGIAIPADPDAWPAAATDPRSLLRGFARATAGAGAFAPLDLTSLAPAARRAQILEAVEERVAAILSLSSEARTRLDGDVPLVDLGLDSLLAAELAALLSKDLSVAFPVAIWAERPSRNALVECVARLIERGAAGQ